MAKRPSHKASRASYLRKKVRVAASKPSSKQKKRPAEKPTRKPKSVSSRKTTPKNTTKKSTDFLKQLAEASSGTPLQAVPLHPSTQRKLKTPSSKTVVYGIQQGKKLLPLEMQPQKFSKKDLQEFQKMLSAASAAQGKKGLPRLAFFQVRSEEVERTPTGKVKKVKVKSGPKKGTLAPIYKTEIKFRKPRKEIKWRTLLYEGNRFERSVQPYFQERDKYEVVKADVLNKIGFTSFEEKERRFVAGFETGKVRLQGKTLTQALRHIQPPVSSLWLKKKKVILKFFKKNKIGNIFVDGSVYVTANGKVQKPIPVKAIVRYMGDLPSELGRAIREHLADTGATYTSPKDLAEIESRIEAKYRSRRKGLKSNKAIDELRRFIRPGRLPKTPQLLSAIRKLQKGKISSSDFPLAKTDSVVVDLRFRFYRDISVGYEDGKKKRRKKK